MVASHEIGVLGMGHSIVFCVDTSVSEFNRSLPIQLQDSSDSVWSIEGSSFREVFVPDIPVHLFLNTSGPTVVILTNLNYSRWLNEEPEDVRRVNRLIDWLFDLDLSIQMIYQLDELVIDEWSAANGSDWSDPASNFDVSEFHDWLRSNSDIVRIPRRG